MKRYEALIILQPQPSDDEVRASVDRISEIITKAEGAVDTVQKMDRKSFARVAHKKATAGFYVNVIFAAPQDSIPKVTESIRGLDEVFRLLVSDAPAVAPPAPVAA